MARLNEPPQPAAESIDALKRRFVRQNREIARVNSTQSVRIRNLECEVSRLLGENLSLRENIIGLEHEVEKQASKRVLEGVEKVKGKLEAKLSELETLVRGLGDVRKTADVQRRHKRHSIGRNSPKRSPDQRVWKNTLTLSEAFGGEDGRLPPIVEGKYYPRRTLDAEELLEIIADPANITDSPDLGPPPVAHFDQGDPIKFDPTPGEVLGPAPPVVAEEAPQKLSANLETRKRRRESSHHLSGDKTRVNPEPFKVTLSKEAVSREQPLKSGAKRKLHVREGEGLPEPMEEKSSDGTQSKPKCLESKSEQVEGKATVNKSAKSISNRTSPTRPLSAHLGREKPVEVPEMNTANSRKALGPKSVNTDPMNSPLKHSRTNSKDKVMDAKDDLAKVVRERNRLKDRSQTKPAMPLSEKDSITKASLTEGKTLEPPPKTPIPPPDDLFSPGLSEPSAPRAESRDTPPPPDLGPDTGTGSFGRASRRPKGNVNYAQPNLRDKMRRPTAELVDAVAAEERARQANIAKAENEKSKSVIIKQEETTDSLPPWKVNEPKDSHRTLEGPPSPLSKKTQDSATDLPPSIVTERRRRTIIAAHDDEQNESAKGSSGAASAIAALTVGNHRPKRAEEKKAESQATVEEAEHQSAERPSIYDFTGSSPNIGPSEEDLKDKGEINEATKSSRSSRRHSTVPAAIDQSKGTLSISRRGERRRESVLGGRRGGDDASTGTLPRTKSVLELGDGSEESATMGRGERAASRRRSMML